MQGMQAHLIQLLLYVRFSPLIAFDIVDLILDCQNILAKLKDVIEQFHHGGVSSPPEAITTLCFPSKFRKEIKNDTSLKKSVLCTHRSFLGYVHDANQPQF